MKTLAKLLQTEFPIIQGGMANIATGAFAAACSRAGALGLIAAGDMDAEALRREIRACRALTDKPFGVNIMLMSPHAADSAQVVMEERVPVVTTGAGSPAKYIPAWKDAGITVIPVIAATVMAQRMAKLGADAVVAEGTESGGHVGEMTTMALVPQVCDAVDIPVIAAGGIADGRQMAAAFALGACGVQLGTCLLVSEECPIHPNYKQALLDACYGRYWPHWSYWSHGCHRRYRCYGCHGCYRCHRRYGPHWTYWTHWRHGCHGCYGCYRSHWPRRSCRS